MLQSKKDAHMNKETLIRKMEEGVTALREELDKNDGSTLNTLAANARAGYESLKTTVMENEKARDTLASLKTHLDSLEKAIVAGDRNMSAKAVGLLEKVIGELKEKKEDDASKQ